jgi:hypothetical protein
MKEANRDFFPCATFSLDQNGHVSFGYSLQLISDGLHCSSFAEENI